MGMYAKYVLPRFIDLAMRNKDTTRVRADWVPHARGDVLEVGIGSGLNLPFYSAEVSRVYGVDPSPELQKLARKRMADQTINVEFLSQSAEEPAAPSRPKCRYGRHHLDPLFHPGPVGSASTDEEGSQAQRPSDIRRAWPRSGFAGCCLARSA